MGLFGFGDAKGMGPVETIVGREASLRGSYNSKGSIRVDGELYGNVTSEDGVIVGERGMIRGNIVAKSVVVGGKVKGNVTAYQRLELQGTAQVEGDISTPILQVEEGAFYEGNCQMEEASKVVDMPRVMRD
jgi:cytoskeletal protein CcmA (bactofilin family)